MIKKLLLSLLIIIAASAAAVTATKALLSDQATLAANTFSTGTVDLKVSKSQSISSPSGFDDQIEGFEDSILPGQTQTKLIWLKNYSSDVDFLIGAQSASVSGSIDPNDVTIAFTPVDPTGTISAGLTISHSLADWNSPDSLESTIINGEKQRYKMEVTLSPSVSTTGSVTFDIIFTGTQTP